MDKLPFRAKPKIVDLTSDRKLADKVGVAECLAHEPGCYVIILQNRLPFFWVQGCAVVNK